jgi:isopentenyl phosphate kinase
LDQVAIAYEILKNQGNQLVLVHGAGSFGHPQAKKYNLKQGWASVTLSSSSRPQDNFIKGYSHIRACLQNLSHAITSRLESRNVPVLAMSPIDFIETTNCEETTTKEFQSMASRVEKYLGLGFVPVLHGDAVLDHIRGCTILSGDIIMYQLTRLLPIARCIFITDVSGIYQSDPKLLSIEESSNQLISHVLVGREQEEEVAVEDSNMTLADVTGGMQGKIKWAKKIVLLSSNQEADVIICKWGSKEALDMMTLEQVTDLKKAMTVFNKK